MLEQLEVTIEGVTPTITHNGRMANPLDKFAKQLKEISGKRKKTDEDYAAMSEIEWRAGLYLNDKMQPCWPSECVESLIISAAKKSKEGPQAKTGLLIHGDFPIKFDGPKNVDALWADERFRLISPVRVGKAKVMRTRPIFREWSLDIVVGFDPEVVNERTLRQWIEVGGRLIGLSDWRPKYGRYEVKA